VRCARPPAAWPLDRLLTETDSPFLARCRTAASGTTGVRARVVSTLAECAGTPTRPGGAHGATRQLPHLFRPVISFDPKRCGKVVTGPLADLRANPRRPGRRWILESPATSSRRWDLIPKIGQYIQTSGGKRMRPAVLLMAARLSGYEGDRSILYAAVVEFIHTATLVHDEHHRRLGPCGAGPPGGWHSRWGNEHHGAAGATNLYIKSMALALTHDTLDIVGCCAT